MAWKARGKKIWTKENLFRRWERPGEWNTPILNERISGWIRPGHSARYFEEKFGTDQEQLKWWGMGDDDDITRREKGRGYPAGLRCARRGQDYCTQNNFSCEACSLAISGRDCHYNPIVQD